MNDDVSVLLNEILRAIHEHMIKNRLVDTKDLYIAMTEETYKKIIDNVTLYKNTDVIRLFDVQIRITVLDMDEPFYIHSEKDDELKHLLAQLERRIKK